MATQAKIVIKGQNNVSEAAKSAAKDLSGLKDSVSKLGSMIKTSLTLTAVIASVKALGNACKTVLLEDFGEANRSYKQLALALKDKSAYDSVVANMDELCKKTLAANGDIEAMVAQLAALGKSSDDINKISTAAVALSNVTGKDLSSSMTTLLNTYNGTTTQLKRMGISLEGITDEELRQGAAIDIVIDKFGEYSDMMAKEDSAQALKNMSETWGDIKEKIGGIIDYNFGPFLSNLDTAFASFGEKINSITIYVGAVIKNFPEVFKLLMSTLWKMVKRTFEWDSIKTIFTTAIETIGKVAVAALKAVFRTIPEMMGAMVSGVLQWIIYIAMNIQASILGAIEGAVNKAGEKIQGTWVGKLFGLSDKLTSFDLGTDRIREEAKTVKEGADASFESIGPMFRNAISDAIALEADLYSGYKDAVTDIYGDIGSEFKDSINALVTPSLEEIAAHSDAANQDKILSRIDKNTSETADNTEGDSSTGTVTSAVTTEAITTLSDKLQSILEPLVDKLSAKGGFLGFLGSGMKGRIGELISAIQPILEIAMKFCSWFTLLLEIVKGFVAVLAPALTTVVQPVFDCLRWIGESTGKSLLPILDQLFVYISFIVNILQAVLAPVLQMLYPPMQVIASLLEMLSPIIRGTAKLFTILMSPVQFVADLLSWLGDWITYCGHAVSTFCYNLVHPFSRRSYGSSPGAFSSDAFTGLADRLAAIDEISFSGGSAATDSVSTGTAVSSASYSGSTHVTINIYQQAPVVGDGGMRAFARMIKSEFLALDYYGVTT